MDRSHKWCPPAVNARSPVIYIVYVNDITDGVQSTLEMFADDTKLYRIIQNPCDTDTLQHDLRKLHF